jgi:hypothetical protein
MLCDPDRDDFLLRERLRILRDPGAGERISRAAERDDVRGAPPACAPASPIASSIGRIAAAACRWGASPVRRPSR